MATGAFHRLTGTLRKTKSNYLYNLKTEDGKRWRLDIVSDVSDLIGQTVDVEGVQTGMDLIDVQKVWKQGDPRPLSPWERIENMTRLLRRG